MAFSLKLRERLTPTRLALLGAALLTSVLLHCGNDNVVPEDNVGGHSSVQDEAGGQGGALL